MVTIEGTENMQITCYLNDQFVQTVPAPMKLTTRTDAKITMVGDEIGIELGGQFLKIASVTQLGYKPGDTVTVSGVCVSPYVVFAKQAPEKPVTLASLMPDKRDAWRAGPKFTKANTLSPAELAKLRIEEQKRLRKPAKR